MYVYICISVQHVVSLPGPPVIKSMASKWTCSPQKKEALKKERHSDTRSIYNNPHLNYMVPGPTKGNDTSAAVRGVLVEAACREQVQFDLFLTALLS